MCTVYIDKHIYSTCIFNINYTYSKHLVYAELLPVARVLLRNSHNAKLNSKYRGKILLFLGSDLKYMMFLLHFSPNSCCYNDDQKIHF